MITTNTGSKKIEGTDNWREIFDAHNDSVEAHDKVSEAMTYVVNGNKSIENAAIPVGSYVRLANSTIVGRSDGIYTVKTAIPVNTVIDSSYFNENAPIPGGVANALNSKLEPVLLAQSTSSSEETVALSESLADKTFILVTVEGQYGIIASCMCPVSFLKTHTGNKNRLEADAVSSEELCGYIRYADDMHLTMRVYGTSYWGTKTVSAFAW